MYCFLKSQHHLANVQISTGNCEEPPRLVKTMTKLETAIRPANLTPATQQMLLGNARNWLHNSLQILEEHYMNSIEEFKGIIKYTKYGLVGGGLEGGN